MRHDLAALERANQSFRHEMWGSVEPEAVEEEGIAAERFGPVLATAFERESDDLDLNLIQGAAEPGAIEEGHLARAIEWMRWREAEYRMPVAAERPGAGLASQWLGERGYERDGTAIAFVRPAGADELPPEGGIAVYELGEHESDGEGFSVIVRQASELPLMAELLYWGLPLQDSWRCYTAVPGPGDRVCAAAAMLIAEEGIAVLGLDSTLESDRDRGCHKALLRRRLLDAAQAGCHTVLAEVGEGEEFAAARHNLIEAGFEPAYVSHDWMRPSLRSALSE